MKTARIVCLLSGAALFVGNAAVVAIDDFVDGPQSIIRPVPSVGPYSDNDTAIATVPGGMRTIGLNSVGNPGSVGLVASITVDDVSGTFNIATGPGADANPYSDPGGLTPPPFTIRYDLGGGGLGGYALPAQVLGLGGITINDLGFTLTIDFNAGAWTKTENVPAGFTGDWLVNVGAAGAALLNNLNSIDIAIDLAAEGDLKFDSVAVPEPANTALAIGGLCFAGFLGRRFLKK